MSKNDLTFFTFFVDLYNYIVPNISNNFQTQRHLYDLVKVTVRFIWSPGGKTDDASESEEGSH